MSDPVSIKDATDQAVDVAADDVAGFGRVQVVKPAFGADGAATLVSAANPMPVSLSDVPLPTGAATDAALVALQAIQSQIGDLSEAMLIVAAAMLERMPRVTSNDQMAVSIEVGAVGITAAQTLATVTNLANIQQLGLRPLHGETLMNAGLTTIYDNLVRT
jgi:hypothetical protein